MAGKPTVTKNDSLRSAIEELHDRIAQRAYELFCDSGRAPGRDTDNWAAAERELYWKPAIEIEENDDGLCVTMAVAGVDPKDITVEVDGDRLVVRGKTEREKTEQRGRLHVCEIETGSLYRAVDLPRAVDPDQVKADVKNGLLAITAKFPGAAPTKKKPAKPKAKPAAGA